jgi:hypothetical protein
MSASLTSPASGPTTAPRVARAGGTTPDVADVAKADDSDAGPVLAFSSTFHSPRIVPLPPVRPGTPATEVADADEPADATEAVAQLASTTAPTAAQTQAADVATDDEHEPDAGPQVPSVRARAMVASAVAGATPMPVSFGNSDPSTSDQTTVSVPGYFAAYENTIISCFPQPLKDALNAISDHYGKPVEVTSGFRDHGRAHSMHRLCMAADIRVAGVAPTMLAAYAKSLEGVNGIGTYRHTSVTHIDIRQEKMAWRY